MNKKYLLNFFLVFFLTDLVVQHVSIWSSENKKESGNEIWTLSFENIKKEQVSLYCEVARSEADKRRGLMFREKLEPDMCMIFLYEKPTPLTFWMYNTKIPLSIAFINEDLHIMDIFDMKPFDESIISSTNPGIYAVEANRGWFKKHFIYSGSFVKIEKKDKRIKTTP
ncbi:MAG: DUF192 domain-containing protein [Spirochaetia bacterium]|nr:DUF192 domain-containing protein [Spirochaetia bacterium]